ncbi:hypothetical protein GCM10009533_16790 [Saccharopolyspora spinosporotrichia]|uniref:Uncharacterized protein n=1 Tax=Saccharopolyspora erythraea TaxID=1836 RepID=A0ABN1CFV0_SACER
MVLPGAPAATPPRERWLSASVLKGRHANIAMSDREGEKQATAAVHRCQDVIDHDPPERIP